MPVLRDKTQTGSQSGKGDKPLPSGAIQIREYVSCMSSELAQMARGQGDEHLACLLELAAEMAKR